MITIRVKHHVFAGYPEHLLGESRVPPPHKKGTYLLPTFKYFCKINFDYPKK